MISGEELKYRNGLAGFLGLSIDPPCRQFITGRCICFDRALEADVALVSANAVTGGAQPGPFAKAHKDPAPFAAKMIGVDDAHHVPRRGHVHLQRHVLSQCDDATSSLLPQTKALFWAKRINRGVTSIGSP